MFKRGLLLFSCLLMAWSVTAQKVLTPELLWEMGRVNGGEISPDQTTLLYGVVNYELSENSGKNTLFLKDLKSGEDRELKLPSSASSAVWTPDGQMIAFLMGGQVYEIRPDGSGLRKVTEVESGVSSFNYAASGDKLAYSTSVKLKPTTADLYPDYTKANAVVIDDLMYRHWQHGQMNSSTTYSWQTIKKEALLTPKTSWAKKLMTVLRCHSAVEMTIPSALTGANWFTFAKRKKEKNMPYPPIRICTCMTSQPVPLRISRRA
ncbi:hypothetical protein [Persicobacter sp. CCB-QB2]|uniref:TolB family protein n=1 Tax=Persicobacter sp. CCB-QB2 TaxID=1561025 RepID=UPI0020A0408F|nr:hypothetical protein [Persicobacter sp. CCB-QB2]